MQGLSVRLSLLPLVLAAFFTLSSCGFLSKKEGSITKPDEKPAVLPMPSNTPNSGTDDANSTGIKASPSASPSTQNADYTNSNGNGSGSVITGESGFETVTEGGAETGLLENGNVYYAPGESIFFNFKYQILNGQTQILSNIYFKDAAPAEAISSHLHSGSCTDQASKHYQHVAGDATPETSELHVSLTGTGNKKSGTGIGKFVPRSEELSYVIHYNGGRLCAPFGPIAASSTASPAPSSTPSSTASATPSPSPSSTVQNPVTAGGNVTGLLADGTPYFAGSDTIYFRYSIRTASGASTLTGEVYFKENGPTEDLASHLHEGTCDNATSPHYQHIAGDATPGTSEFHVALKGTNLVKKGTATVNFVPRSVPLSYVIHYNGTRLCSNMNLNSTSTSSPTPTPSGTTGVTPGGNVSGLLADGTPYFAPGHSFFFIVKYNSINNVTTVNGEIYYKSVGVATDLMSHVHAGSCANATSAHYQHIPGDATPEKSEIHVNLTGTPLVKKGTGVGKFAFRNEPLSYVIHVGDNRLCTNLN
jgi:hypothetical protein